MKILADATDDTVNCQNTIKKEIKNFYTNLFKRKSNMTVEQCIQFLDTIELPCLTQRKESWIWAYQRIPCCLLEKHWKHRF